MKPVYQTKFGDPEGNCLMACVASVLEISLEECPVLWELEQQGKHWVIELNRFLGTRGWMATWLNYEDSVRPPRGYSLISGMGPRGLKHVCVALNGEIVHDPFPRKDESIPTGLKTVEYYMVLVPSAEERIPGECTHPALGLVAKSIFLSDTKRHLCELQIHCIHCNEIFRFIGCQSGVYFDQPSVDVSGEILSMPIAPKDQVLSELEGTPMGITCRRTK